MTCQEGTRKMAVQIENLLEQLGKSIYTQRLKVFRGSSLGQHFRHILDFYNCLLKGIHIGEVDYAKRERDIGVEEDPQIARIAFKKVLQELIVLNENSQIPVKADFSSEITDFRPVVSSTIGRELMFVYDHAVHHLAIIKIGLESTFPDLELDDNLGVAPSTIKYRAGEKAMDA